ncbi:hypothetical protein AHF37_07237 [Paragonimus kellicotti]|nr:hypothetical protein AHF37_07237 [Paragonimus kellicotti]
MSLNNYNSKFPTCLSFQKRNFAAPCTFLLKCLSFEKALSIQAHPTKEHAQLLHAQRPDLYKDANHKPELAITLTPFEALLGFRSLKHIASFVQGVPELLEIVGNDCLSDLISVSQLVEDEDSAGIAIKAAYQKLMRTDEEKVASLVNQLRDRLLQGEQLQFSVPDHINLSELADVFIRLSTQFPGDVGCFSLFFLNYIKLETGQAVFLEANLPHAYLSGDCVECMACSDNVVRAGLTPKYKDVDCLLNMLQYEPRTAEDLIFPGESRPVELPAVGPWLSDAEITSRLPTPQVIRFAPPVEDFAVDKAACEFFFRSSVLILSAVFFSLSL